MIRFPACRSLAEQLCSEKSAALSKVRALGCGIDQLIGDPNPLGDPDLKAALFQHLPRCGLLGGFAVFLATTWKVKTSACTNNCDLPFACPHYAISTGSQNIIRCCVKFPELNWNFGHLCFGS